MVAGHLREQNGIYQMILCYKDTNNKRCSKSISTGLPVKGNKKKAEALLAQTRKSLSLQSGIRIHTFMCFEWSGYNMLLWRQPNFLSTSTISTDGLCPILKSISAASVSCPFKNWNSIFPHSEKPTIHRLLVRNI